MAPEPVRYVSADEDSARWIGFPFREGDIVISTRSKTGTTWVQMICALLIFQVPELPAPLGRYSPWLDRVIYPQRRQCVPFGRGWCRWCSWGLPGRVFWFLWGSMNAEGGREISDRLKHPRSGVTWLKEAGSAGL